MVKIKGNIKTTGENESNTLVVDSPSFNILPAGIILPYSGSSSPTGGLICNGSTASRTTYSALFAIMGIAYGNGDGSTTFHLPDTRGRFLRGVDGGVARDPDRAARTASNTGGNTGDNVGSIQGDEYKSHIHGQSAQTNPIANSGPWSAVSPTGSAQPVATAASGGNETRPINLYCNYVITTGGQ